MWMGPGMLEPCAALQIAILFEFVTPRLERMLRWVAQRANGRLDALPAFQVQIDRPHALVA